MNILIKARRNLQEVLDKRTAILKKLAEENRDATPEEKAELETLQTRKASCQETIKQIEELREDQDGFDPGAPGEDSRSSRKPNVTVTREEGENDKGQFVPFRDMGEQLLAVREAANQPYATDKRLLEINKRAAAAGMNETVGQDGGFLVQTDFSTELVRQVHETGILASRVRRFPLSTNATGISIPVVEETSRADGARWGGVQAYWEEEAAVKTPSKPKFGKLGFRLKKLIGLCYATDELLEDASALGSVITQGFTEEFGYRIDDAIIQGNGTSMPLGFANSPALVVIAKESGQAAATLLGDNVLKMYGRFWSRSMTRGIWLVNQAVIPLLPKLFISGTNTDFQIFTPAGTNGVPQNQLLGMPVLPIEQSQALGTQGDIMLIDPTQYGMIERGGMQTATSIHVRFTTDETAFRFVMRLDGMPLWKQPITPAHGTQTLSPFVTLATRA